MTSERFAALAEKYMDTIYRLAYSCTRSTADADDVTQEVLIHLYREEKDFQSDEHVKKLADESDDQSVQNTVPFSLAKGRAH